MAWVVASADDRDADGWEDDEAVLLVEEEDGEDDDVSSAAVAITVTEAVVRDTGNGSGICTLYSQ